MGQATGQAAGQVTGQEMGEATEISSSYPKAVGGNTPGSKLMDAPNMMRQCDFVLIYICHLKIAFSLAPGIFNKLFGKLGYNLKSLC